MVIAGTENQASDVSVGSASEWELLNPPEDVVELFEEAKSVKVFWSVEEILENAVPAENADCAEVAYEVEGKGRVVEAVVARVRNGISANYTEPYMRRRDPKCMVIGDGLATDKTTFKDRFNKEFDPVRDETLEWLKSQDLVCFGFHAGSAGMGSEALVIAPANAGFFALGLSLLQGILAKDKVPDGFTPTLVIYVAPPFRHTHFDGKQVVVHNRSVSRHEIFSYNLYPGPSAKKGVYGSLLTLGEKEGWITAHCSTVRVITPYDNDVTIMHEGASGGGKSEMLEYMHREPDGRLLLGENVVTGEKRFLELPRGCQLRPVTDDMALCHPHIQKKKGGRLRLMDAEQAWFVRVNHVTRYATDPFLEGLTAQPPEPLLFLNIDAVPNGRALLWEHVEDAPGQPCPNPRVVIPRKIIPDIVDGAVSVDIRSFGIRTPPCTREKPTYGIFGIMHLLPPALAWLWRLVAPRGFANPSITDSEALTSEGVGSYWPFATGRRVDHANMLLEQIKATPKVVYILCPNQHVGSWKTGFSPQWVAREYLARRGSARFRAELIKESRCPLLGYSLNNITVEGRSISSWFLEVDSQPEVGPEAYDAGAEILYDFFAEQLPKFVVDDLSEDGRRIIECCLDRGNVQEMEGLL